jgi:hypothetical protein
MPSFGHAAFVCAALVAMLVGGCSRWSGFCSDKMACLDGNDNDVNACEVKQEAEEDRASVKGCDQAWDDFARCQIDHYACKDKQWTDGDACDAKEHAYNECAK